MSHQSTLHQLGVGLAATGGGAGLMAALHWCLRNRWPWF